MYKERIRQRATGQKAGIMALLEFTYANGKTIRKLVGQQRETLTGKKPVNEYAIQMKHVQTGEEHPLPVCSFLTGKDTVIMVKDYRPLVKPVYTVKRPVGYLVPNNRPELVNWCNRHNLQTQVVPSLQKFKIEQYHINKIDSIDFETEIVINPEVTLSSISNVITGEYIFIPVNQLKGYMIIAALEPKSMLGLVTYPSFSHLIKAGENFPVLRVVRK